MSRAILRRDGNTAWAMCLLDWRQIRAFSKGNFVKKNLRSGFLTTLWAAKIIEASGMARDSTLLRLQMLADLMVDSISSLMPSAPQPKHILKTHRVSLKVVRSWQRTITTIAVPDESAHQSQATEMHRGASVEPGFSSLIALRSDA